MTLRLRILLAAALLAAFGCADRPARPSFLILMSDNQSWNHLASYGDPVVRTPTISRLAAEGVRFTHAFCNAPSCTPARAAMLTGQDIWRLEEGANLWGTLPAKFPVYTDLLEDAGYAVGYSGKGWGPGDFAAGGRARNPAGDEYESFQTFLAQQGDDRPFCFWFSSRNPHRPYQADSQDVDRESITVPPYLPDTPEVRADIAAYYAEVEAFDREVSDHLRVLIQAGEFDDTVIIVASDNGWQMPRGLANLYDFGTRVPLIITAPKLFPAGRVVDDLVTLADLAPTLLELGRAAMPEGMTARTLTPILASDESGVIEPDREFVALARERHAFVRQDGMGYPGRALRTREFLYIRNYEPDRWPAGDPPLYGDVDAQRLQYPAPTKMQLLTRRDEEGVRPLFRLGFEKRPREELYDLVSDPQQMFNLASKPEYAQRKQELADRLTAHLRATRDPRETGEPFDWDAAEYFQDADKRPEPSPEAIEALGLAPRYSYIDP